MSADYEDQIPYDESDVPLDETPPEEKPLDEEVKYEDHLVPSHDSDMLGGLFGIFEESIKSAVIITKEVGSDMAYVAGEFAKDLRPYESPMSEPELSPEEAAYAARRAWADEQWAKILEHKEKQKELDHGLDLGR